MTPQPGVLKVTGGGVGGFVFWKMVPHVVIDHLSVTLQLFIVV